MNSIQVRQSFFDFFSSKQHKIVPSAPMVVKNDPTLMFTNAGMNQFKDIFLGNTEPKEKRVANTQKCLRVSGKHNDLEEVGHDTYHHTMFEMLGNWSFGDYFKKEAIAWAWEFLTKTLGIDEKVLYITVFGGDAEDGLDKDLDAYNFWKEIVAENRIIFGSKKDNFWEMGDTGPCGPCSEIHIDLRSDDEKSKTMGRDLVNADHPEVIEIWNLVFIEFNRNSNGSLQNLPAKHVDTGMGFERLCMALQGKKSNYDTDIFQPIIQEISAISHFEYGTDKQKDIAMRVVADHLRAVSFSIADGQLPSNVKAGYVIRRILRRAIRYGFTYLDLQEPFIHKLVGVLAGQMGKHFPEIEKQQELITRVIHEEEATFLRTLSLGIKKFEQYVEQEHPDKLIEGKFAFELFDTYGFPVDLTRLMASEIGWKVDMEGFNHGLEEQKNRSRQAAEKEQEDWVVVHDADESPEFIGYDSLSCDVKILRYRKVSEKKKTFYQVVFDKTPFYAESGGQVGDRGILTGENNTYEIEDTIKENDLIIHIMNEMPADPQQTFTTKVDHEKRLATANNHSATHLMHAALRKVLGNHVEQKGSLVDEYRLRFDFSHFSKLSEEEKKAIEHLVNAKIRENIPIGEHRQIPIDKAKEMGAMALFGEKYGDEVRVITFDENYSVELCGGTHVPATGQIGMFKIISESAIAAGIRRIEAITAYETEKYVDEQEALLDELKEVFKNQKDLVKGARTLLEQNNELRKTIEVLNREKARNVSEELKQRAEIVNGLQFIAAKVDLDMAAMRDLAFQLNREIDNLFLILGADSDGKANLSIIISEDIAKQKNLHAGNMIREIAKEIRGGGGGQPHFATAGGKFPEGIQNAFNKAREMLAEKV
ncbi:MAG: alanine--tRNA ligase [Bacteroidales bacterium]|nr:alanine--tRNA ligase [Bacteroidales bacterium]